LAAASGGGQDARGRPGSAPAAGRVVALYNGEVYRGNPRDIPLTAHGQIQLDAGTPLIAPQPVSFPPDCDCPPRGQAGSPLRVNDDSRFTASASAMAVTTAPMMMDVATPRPACRSGSLTNPLAMPRP